MKTIFPVFSLLSVAAPFGCGFGSFPIWLVVLDNHANGPEAFYVFIAAITVAFLTAAAGGLVGVALVAGAFWRREQWRPLQWCSLLGNLGFAAYGLHVFLSLPRE